MSFANFSWPWVLAGLGLLAAGLYALQILRIRYREVTVVSTLLWRKAMQEAPVRKLREHFKHPWAYALVLAICSLIWLALAEPQIKQTDDGRFHVLILDGSAAMAAGDRYEDAVQALKDQVRSLPPERRQVLWSGAQVRSLLNPGEDDLLLDRRLKSLKPEAAPAGAEKLIGDLSATRHGRESTEVLLFGAAPVSKTVIASLPKDFSVKRAKAIEPLKHNSGITALGFADAQSGHWDKVDVYLQAQATGNEAVKAQDLSIDLDGKPVTVALQPIPGGEGGGWLLQELPAQGGLLTVRLSGKDDLELDNSASLRLPNKPFINVQLSPQLDAQLRAVLLADPAIRVTDTDAMLVIRNGGESIGGNLPALEFVGANSQPQAFLLTYPKNVDAEGGFTEAVNAIGLKQIDAMALADAARRPIEVSMKAGEQWKVSLWQELLGEDFNFTRSRSFPLFIASSVRWLAGIQPGYPYAAAGEPLSGDSIDSVHVVDDKGRPIDALGVKFTPEQAGPLALASRARPLAVSLLDPVTTEGGADSSLEVASSLASDGVSSSHWVTALILLALLLLAAEWYWYRKGRMP